MGEREQLNVMNRTSEICGENQPSNSDLPKLKEEERKEEIKETKETKETKEQETSEQETSWTFHCPCGINQLNYDDGLPMVECSSCKAWSHIACTKYNEQSRKDFTCVWCRNRRGNCKRQHAK